MAGLKAIATITLPLVTRLPCGFINHGRKDAMAEPLSLASNIITFVSLGVRIAGSFRNFGRHGHDYDIIMAALGNTMETIQWLTSQMSITGSNASIPEGFPLQEIAMLYEEVEPVFSDLLALLEESQRRSPMSVPWRLHARQKSIVARLEDLSGKLEKLVIAIRR